MKLLKLFLPALSAVGMMTYTASALAEPVTIADITTSLSTASPKEAGRLSRSGIPTDFGTVKAFPGLINTTTSYSYTTFTFASSLFAGGQNVEVFFNDIDNYGGFFVSAYAGSYNPLSPGSTYLGDDGSSGNAFTTDPQFMNIVLAANTDLVLVVNETLGGTNSANSFVHSFDLLVQHSATDALGNQYGDPIAPTPEPSSLILLGTGVLGIVEAARRRFAA